MDPCPGLEETRISRLSSAAVVGNDGQAQAAATVARVIAALLEFLEDFRGLVGGNPDAAVPDFDPGLATPSSATDANTATLGVLDGVNDQIAKQALEQDRIGAPEAAGGDATQSQSFLLRFWGIDGFQTGQNVGDGEISDVWLDDARLQLAQ